MPALHKKRLLRIPFPVPPNLQKRASFSKRRLAQLCFFSSGSRQKWAASRPQETYALITPANHAAISCASPSTLTHPPMHATRAHPGPSPTPRQPNKQGAPRPHAPPTPTSTHAVFWQQPIYNFCPHPDLARSGGWPQSELPP